MKFSQGAGGAIVLGLIVALAVLSPPAVAQVSLSGTEAAAAQACGADEVVWVDLDRGRFYHKGQAEYAKGSNGGYGCLKQVGKVYRPSHAQ